MHYAGNILLPWELLRAAEQSIAEIADLLFLWKGPRKKPGSSPKQAIFPFSWLCSSIYLFYFQSSLQLISISLRLSSS